MAETKIQWSNKVWNPVTGCTKVSQGCKHCYAEAIANRMWATQYPPNADGTARKFTDVRLHPDRLEMPLHWRKPAMIFVNSMSDLFHEAVPDEFIGAVFAVMLRAPQHTFQILTKRPERMVAWFRDFYANQMPSLNVWLGVSVEDQAAAALRAAAEQAELKQMERDCAAQCSECKKGVPRANLFHWHQNGDRTDCGAWHIRTAWGTRTAPVTTVRHEP